MKFEGVFTALVTPYISGDVDFTSLKQLIKHQLDNGVEGFVVNGTTGESPTLTASESEAIFNFVKSEVSGQVPLIFGTGTNCTRSTVDRTKKAEELGADAVLVVTPYYNKPTQRGITEHFRTVSEFTSLPVLLYNVPGRTQVRIELEALKELSRRPNIMGVKDATGDVAFGQQTLDECGPGFLVTSGDDGTSVELCAKGGHGVISVCSHIFPKEMTHLISEARSGNSEKALEEFKKYDQVLKMLYIESNPIPVKAALKMMGIIRSHELRLPMTSLSEQFLPELETSLKEIGVLS